MFTVCASYSSPTPLTSFIPPFHWFIRMITLKMMYKAVLANWLENQFTKTFCWIVRIYFVFFFDPSSCSCIWAWISPYFLKLFYWRIVALHNFVVFCQTSTWIRHRIHISPPFWTSLPSPFPSHPCKLTKSPCLSFLSQTANSHQPSILKTDSPASHKVVANKLGEPFMQTKFENRKMWGGS